jgi:hypothetical protein
VEAPCCDLGRTKGGSSRLGPHESFVPGAQQDYRAAQNAIEPEMVSIPGGRLLTWTCPEEHEICGTIELVERMVTISEFRSPDSESVRPTGTVQLTGDRTLP